MTKTKAVIGKQIDAFTSVYRMDYPPKSCEIPAPVIIKSDYPDILRGANMDYLLPDDNVAQASDAALYDYEGGGKFYNKNYHVKEELFYFQMILFIFILPEVIRKLINKIPKLKRHLESEVDDKFIKREYQDNGRTQYQIDYCRIEDGFVSPKTLARQRIQLPSDWGDPPLTVQRKSYRDPRKILKEGENIISRPFKPPPSELVLSAEIKEILQIRTGETEYQSHIGLLGHQIIKDKLFGNIDPLPNEYIPPN